METTRILWSDLTGRTGQEALRQAATIPNVEIVAGLKRNVSEVDDSCLHDKIIENVVWFNYETGVYGLYGLAQLTKRAEIDVIVDFSHPDVFDRVLELAIRAGKPLISGTSGLSVRQMASLHYATNHISVFRSDNFCFKVKRFINEAVKLAVDTPGDLHCRIAGFDELAHDVLEIAKVMTRKPVKQGEFYDLDDLWDDLVSWVL